MTTETLVLIAGGAVALKLASGPRYRRRRGSRHVVRRTVRHFRRPKSTLSFQYTSYINSHEWRRVREKALFRAGYRCEHQNAFGFRCDRRYGLQAHHRHYRHFGWEWAASVTPPAWAQHAWQRAGSPPTQGECLRVLCHSHHAQADKRRKRYGG